MAPLAHLLLAACALFAPLHAASIPDTPSELHNNIPTIVSEEIKEPVESVPIGDDLTVLSEAIKPAEDIPVEVVVEKVEPSIKTNEVADDEEIKRPQVDLRNPGPPQRQEHETQNPEHYSEDELRISTIKEKIEQTQNLLRQGFQEVTDDIQNWLSNNEQFKIQQNVQKLRDGFTAQIHRLSAALGEFAKPPKPAETEKEEIQTKSDFRNIESRLKALEDNFNKGINTLSEGIHIVAGLKSAGANTGREEGPDAPVSPPAQPTAPVAPPAQPAPSIPPQNVLMDYISNFSTAVQNSFSSATTAISNFVSNRTQEFQTGIQNIVRPSSTTLPPGVQADPGVTTTARPPFPLNWNFFNIPNIAQNGQNGQPAFPSLSQVLGNWFPRPGASTAQPAEAAGNTDASKKPVESKPDTASDAPVVTLPASPPVEQPAAQPAALPAAQPTPVGPIRQILNNSPVVQGITNAVQRIQSSITHTERLRDAPEKSDDAANKGGLFLKPPHRPGGSGDNIDVGGLSAQDTEEKEQEHSTQEEPVKETKVTEVEPEKVSEKTE